MKSDPALSTDVRFLKGVGPARSRLLGKLGVRTVEDLIFLFPRRYEDRRHLSTLADLVPGTTGTVVARVVALERKRTRRKDLTLVSAILTDDRGFSSAVWFNRPGLERVLKPGVRAAFYGRIEERYGRIQITNPDFEVIDGEDGSGSARIVPVYPLVEGLNQRWIRRLVESVLPLVAEELEETLPRDIRERHGLMDVVPAVSGMHYPEDPDQWKACRRRIAFEELFLLQLGLALRRRDHDTGRTALPIRPRGETLGRFFSECLPFSLTEAQDRVFREILDDMAAEVPMNRLLQGDVGSGKTAIAAAALVAAVDGGHQAAMMVPTEVLAWQHYDKISGLLAPLDMKVVLLTGSLSKAEREVRLNEIATGEAHVVIGTHALIQEGVEFRALGLSIVDEQHRFGVLQRGALAGKGATTPHVLVMTATPIPRTITLTLYGDLNVSVIDELPPGRKGVRTFRARPSEKPKVLDFIRREIGRGRQIYWVCPLVEDSDTVEATSVQERFADLQGRFHESGVGLLHGQMNPAEKTEVIEKFRTGHLGVLVSTTVIEVGVDVPNATVMVIEDAQRFGLSQLHQLRGRVGRGDQGGTCILLGHPSTEEGARRLEAMCATSDGFRIAETDLRLRGPGEVCGIRQHGVTDFRVADLVKDVKLLREARCEALDVVKADPTLDSVPELKARLVRTLGDRLDLAVTA